MEVVVVLKHLPRLLDLALQLPETVKRHHDRFDLRQLDGQAAEFILIEGRVRFGQERMDFPMAVPYLLEPFAGGGVHGHRNWFRVMTERTGPARRRPENPG